MTWSAELASLPVEEASRRIALTPLVLAEVELDSEAAEVAIPPWLQPCVVRKVTDDPAYSHVNLGRTKTSPWSRFCGPRRAPP